MFERDRWRWCRVITLLTPRDVPGSSSSCASGYSRPAVTMPRAAPPTGSKVTRLPGVPSIRMRSPRPPCTTITRRAEAGLDLDVGPRGRREEQQVGEEVIEASTAPADHDDAGCPGAGRRVDRELEIGRVLGGRVSFDHGALRDGRVDRLRDRPSRGHRRCDRRAARVPAQMEAGIGRDDEVGGGSSSRTLAGTGSPPASTSAQPCMSLPPPALPGAGSRGRWKGGADGAGHDAGHAATRAGHPLSPVPPSSPWVWISSRG